MKCKVWNRLFFTTAAAFLLGVLTLAHRADARAGGEGLRIYHIDLGSAEIKGDAVLLESEGEFLLIDTGLKDPEDHVVRFLKEKGVETLSVYISHFHSDHFGERDDILSNFRVTDLYVCKRSIVEAAYRYAETKSSVSAAEKKGIEGTLSMYDGLKEKSDKSGGTGQYPKFHETDKDDVFMVGDAQIRTFGTPNFSVTDFSDDKDLDAGLSETALEHYLNNMSLCTEVTVTSGGKSYRYLSCGDAEKEEEAWLLSQGVDLSSDIFKMNHHGTDTSNTDAFLKKVSPKHSVANHYATESEITRQNKIYQKLGLTSQKASQETARKNLYGLIRTYAPMKAAEQYGEVYRTQFNGSLTFEIAGGVLSCLSDTGFREENGGYSLYDQNRLVRGSGGFITGYCDSVFAVDGNGVLRRGLFTYQGKMYHCMGAHHMAEIGEGLYTVNGKTYYTAPYTCYAASGWTMIDSKRYYFIPKTCVMAKNVVQKVDAKTYIYFTSKGLQYQKSGWIKLKGSKYYITPGAKGTGKVFTKGWLKIGAKKYFFAKNGKLTKTK